MVTPKAYVDGIKARITEPIMQANKIALIAVCVAVGALLISMGAFSHAH